MTHTQESTPTLQPCPFCGGEVLEFMPMPAPWGVICRKCGAETCLADTKAEAIAAWNRRTPPASQSDEALVEELARAMIAARSAEPSDQDQWHLWADDARAILPIIERVRREGIEEARGLLLELALLVHADKPVFHLGRDAFPDFWPWTNRFRRLLDIYTPEAHLAAAMMLVPEWPHLVTVKELWNGPGTENGKSALATIARYGKTMWTGDFSGLAATPALALVAAIARSVE